LRGAGFVSMKNTGRVSSGSAWIGR